MTQNKLWTPLQRNRLSRRKRLSSSAKVGVGAAGLALVGCGDDDDDSASQAEAPAVSDTFSWKMCPSFEAPFAGLYAWVSVPIWRERRRERLAREAGPAMTDA